MLINIAWRNIWRSKTRSLIVIGSIIIGIWALIFLLGFFRGQINNYISNIIENETSHIQFHHPNFKDDFEARLYMADATQITNDLRSKSDIQSATSRILLNGMLSSSAAAQGVMAKGINPDEENLVTRLQEKIIDGHYFQTDKKNQLLISERLAHKLKVKVRSKVVITFQNINRDITSAAFRIVGIYKTVNKTNDELYVFAHLADLQRMAEMPDSSAHEIALLVNQFDSTEYIAQQLASDYADWKIENYKEISPDLELFNSQIKLNMRIMTTIFMLALIFGIINTMLMAVLERMKELGMLMAVGMNKVKVFFMVVLETSFISLIGAPIGLLLGYFTLRYLNRVGIDLSNWSSALEEFGMSSIVRPVANMETFMTVAVAVIITAILAAIYPALKAIKLRPVEALRKI